MKLLLDANLSPSLVGPLTDAGYDVVHVAELGLLAASDDTIFEPPPRDVALWSRLTATSR